MSRVFVIADLHFGHRLIAGLRGFASPIEHDNAIVAAWNSTVSKRDVVYVLGDVFSLDRIPELHGCKKLALGNHDRRPVTEYAQHFSKVQGCFEYDNCLLTHVPISTCQFPRYDMNIHGHKHAGWIDDLRYICVSAEHALNWTPFLLPNLIAARRLARTAILNQ